MWCVHRPYQAQRRHESPLGQRVERAQLLIVDDQLGRRAEKHGHHAVMARETPHHAGVAIDPRRHATRVTGGSDTPSPIRRIAPGLTSDGQTGARDCAGTDN